jgi:hypothetical protein
LTHTFDGKKASMAAAVCYGVRGGGAQLCSTLWDGLPSHRSRAMRDLLHTQRHWLVIERLPAYAPKLTRSRACGPA